MGPESAKSFPGRAFVAITDHPGARAYQEADNGRRGHGYDFGAFCPATGWALTHCYDGRTTANWVAFLETVDATIAPEVGQVSAILDNLWTHRATDVLLWLLAHPR